ncbi:MAG TPA: AraC family transcriptional regulator [Clostridiales bacterium]|nr:AraC family transcriptional regulator [Clostridiales bacterium]
MEQDIVRKDMMHNNPIIIIKFHHKKTEEFTMHKHEFFEFVYIEKGEAAHTVNGRHYTLKRGDFFVLDVDSSHKYYGDFSLINCLVSPEFIDKTLKDKKKFIDLINNYLIKFSYEQLSESPANKMFYDRDKSILALFNRMYEEYKAKKPGYQEIMRSILVELIIHMLRNVYSYYSKTKSLIIRNCIQEIDRNFDTRFTLKSFCEAHHYNSSYICRKFAKEMGMSFSDYLQTVRVNEAQRLLVNSEKKISEIAQSCGYNDMKQFLTVFQKYTGMTPSAYQKQGVRAEQ